MEKNNRQAPFVNIGSSLLLVIFLILCLVTFATLSLSSARSDASFSERLAARKTEYYEAVNRAEEMLAQVDGLLEDGLTENTNFSQIDPGITCDFSQRTIAWQVPINESQALDVELLVEEEAGGSFCRIQKWQTVNTEKWESDQNLQLLPVPDLD